MEEVSLHPSMMRLSRSSWWRSPFQVIAWAAADLQVPVLAQHLPPLRFSASMKRTIEANTAKLNKLASHWHMQRAREFGCEQVAKARGLKQIYVDASAADSGRVGIACTMYDEMKREIWTKKYCIEGIYATIGTGEKLALLRALRHIKRKGIAEHVHVFSDSQATVKAAIDPKSKCRLARETYHLLQGMPNVFLHWIPSHVGILGNERADSLAAEACSGDDQTLEFQPSVSDAKRMIKQRIACQWQQLWDSSPVSPALHALAPKLLFSSRHIIGTSLARQMARIRLGYTYLGKYRHRHGLADTSLCSHTSCNYSHLVEDEEHFFLHCKRHELSSSTLRDTLNKIARSHQWNWLDVLDCRLTNDVQVRIGNSLLQYLEDIDVDFL